MRSDSPWKITASRRNEMRDTVAMLQQKFQEQSIQQNTARLNIEQLEKKRREIRGGYTRIEREQEEIRLQARDMQADNIKITQELEASKGMRKSWKRLSRPGRRSWRDWKKDRSRRLQRSWKGSVLTHLHPSRRKTSRKICGV